MYKFENVQFHHYFLAFAFLFLRSLLLLRDSPMAFNFAGIIRMLPSSSDISSYMQHTHKQTNKKQPM